MPSLLVEIGSHQLFTQAGLENLNPLNLCLGNSSDYRLEPPRAAQELKNRKNFHVIVLLTYLCGKHKRKYAIYIYSEYMVKANQNKSIWRLFEVTYS
jgi:hypothetical protein